MFCFIPDWSGRESFIANICEITERDIPTNIISSLPLNVVMEEKYPDKIVN